MFPLGNRCASINAGTLALIDAGIPMKDFVCASSATYLEDTPMLGGHGSLCKGYVWGLQMVAKSAVESILCRKGFTVPPPPHTQHPPPHPPTPPHTHPHSTHPQPQPLHLALHAHHHTHTAPNSTTPHH